MNHEKRNSRTGNTPEIKTKKENTAKNPALFRLGVIGLSLFLAVNLITLIGTISDQNTIYHYEYSDMQWAMEDGDYPELISKVARNRVAGAQTSEDTSEFEAIADYYEAATLYHAYSAQGEEEKAALQLEKKQEAEKGILSREFLEAKERIDQIYQVTE